MKTLAKALLAAGALAAALFVASQARGSGTWTGLDPLTRTGTFTTGTEVCTGFGATDGFSLSGVSGFSVLVSSTGYTGFDAGLWPDGSLHVGDALNAFTACTLQACGCSIAAGCAAGQWVRASDADLSLEAVAAKLFEGFRVTNRRDRIAWVPSGCGQPSVELITGTGVSLYH